jgi:hypothetical protein
MKKMTLDADALRVESFEPAPPEPASQAFATRRCTGQVCEETRYTCPVCAA